MYSLMRYTLLVMACAASSVMAADTVLNASDARITEQTAEARFVIQPPREATLASQMSGRLVRFVYETGEAFAQGKRLAEFDCDERKAQLDKAKAEMHKATRVAASQKQLRDLKAISDLDYEIAEADLLIAKADVAMAQAQVDQCYVTAPYAGRVVRNIANPHEHMTVGSPLMDIVETGQLRIDLLVPSMWLRWLQQGQVFTIHIDELDQSFAARVASLGARIDAASQTITVRATITDPSDALLPGMSGIARFEVK